MKNNNISICFVANFAYGALAGGESGHIGGVERQTTMMAKWFAKNGYKVSMLTWDEGQKDGEEIDGVKVFKMCRRDEGLKGLRFIWPRWTSLNAAMKRANADIYYQNCAECVTGQVALWCRINHKKFIYSVASEPDCDSRLPKMSKLRERVLYKYAIKHANKIIVQTKKQKDMLQSGFGADSIIMPMPCPGLSDQEYAEFITKRVDSKNMLWIGRICQVKRPDRLIEIAKLCPDINFDFVGPLSNQSYSKDVCERAKTISNIKIHGPVSREQIGEYYKKARIFLCTSEYEGFPNTFLEAWSYGLPIVSTFDPDNLITNKNLGIVCTNINDMVSAINKMIKEPELWNSASKCARKYYVENHNLNDIMKCFEKIFIE